MIDIPNAPCCPSCKTKGIDNLNMIFTIITEQPLAYFKKIPTRISLNKKTSLNSSQVNWEKGRIICRKCGFSSKNPDDFEG
jgi:uncharacterized protein YbaR (Trm112 family)